MSRTKPDIVADIDPITDFHVLLTRLGAPKRDLDGAPKQDLEKDAQDALALAMIEVGNKLDIIRGAFGDWDYKTNSNRVSFENEAYTEMFESLYKMPWRCVEANKLGWARYTDVPLSEALRTVVPVVLLLKQAHFSLADAEDARRWGDVLAAITVFEVAYEAHGRGLAVAIRALSDTR